jgi:phage-related protein
MADGTISIDVELNEKAFKASLDNMGDTVKTGADKMTGSIGGLSGSFSLLPDTIKTVMDAVPGIINSVISNIGSRNSVMTKTGTDFFTSLVSNLPNITAAVRNAASGISDAALKRFDNFMPNMRNTGTDLFGSLISNIKNITKDITGASADISDAALKRFSDFMPGMSAAGTNFFRSLISNIAGITRDISGAVPQITDNIAETVANDQFKISNAGFDLFTAVTARLPRAKREIARAPAEIVSALTEKFDDLNIKFNPVGENIVRGVWSGISSMGAWLSDKATGFFDRLVGTVTSFLGISSPSKLFRDLVGRNIALGIGAGIDGEMAGVINNAKTQMSRLASAAVQSASIAPGAADAITRSGIMGGQYASADAQCAPLRQNAGAAAAVPEISVTLEPTADIRGFFDYISMGIKRADYLSGKTGSY